MLYVICGLFSIITILSKNRHKLLDRLFLLLLFFIGGLSTIRPDYQVYYDFFKIHSISLGSMSEPLYLLINTIAEKTGMTYELFYAIQVAFGLYSVFYAAKYFKANISVVLMLFMAFPFALCVVQIRNFVSLAIVLFGITFLHKYYIYGKIHFLIKYIILIILAGMIHFSSLFYLICVLPVLLRKIKSWKVILLGFIFGTLLSNIDLLFSIFVPLIGERKAGNWLSNRDSFSINHLLLIIVVRLCVIGFVFLCKYTYKDKVLTLEENNLEETDQFLFKQIIFLIITIFPLELFIQQYDRFTRLYLILIYILVSRSIQKMCSINKFFIWLFIIFTICIICYYEYSRGANSGRAIWNTVFRSVFESNMLLK